VPKMFFFVLRLTVSVDRNANFTRRNFPDRLFAEGRKQVVPEMAADVKNR